MFDRWLLCGLCLCSVAPAIAGPVALRPAATEGRPARWLDVADHPYRPDYRAQYRYADATVVASVVTGPQGLRVKLLGHRLKPFFCYQVKFEATPDSADGERLGRVGRWWCEEWDGHGWSGGANLNDKGDGRSPSPNDRTYAARRPVAADSPSGRRFRFRAYWLFGFVTTDGDGGLDCELLATSSYHAVFKSTQRQRQPDDGPSTAVVVTPDPAQHPAYAAAWPPQTVQLYAEWERLPTGGCRLPVGVYHLQLLLGEESFHGSGGEYAGDWAKAMAGEVHVVVDQPTAAASADRRSWLGAVLCAALGGGFLNG